VALSRRRRAEVACSRPAQGQGSPIEELQLS
jgi:hypothetical protein